MNELQEDAPAFVVTPKGDELVILTRAHYDRLRAEGAASRDDAEDADIGETSRRDWIAAGMPTIPLAVVRRLRAGETPLKAFRAFRGLTQIELARKAGVAQGYVSDVERGARRLSDKTAAALAAALEVHAGVLSSTTSPGSPERRTGG